MKSKKGFTLLELMVAMGIMAVLVTLSIFGIQTVQRSLRNTQRQDALKTLQLSVQGYFNDFGEYPTLGVGGDLQFSADAITLNGETVIDLKGATTPASDTSSEGTAYCYTTGQGSYSLGAKLEGDSGFEYQIGNSGTDCDTQNVI